MQIHLHEAEGYLELEHEGRALCRYVYRPDTPRYESPRPYFHPVTTLGGALLTDYRPPDHPWHVGISMTVTNLSGHNFWGGPSFVRDQGYVPLPNQGVEQHLGWSAEDPRRLVESLSWIGHDGSQLLEESRTLVPHISGERLWGLTLRFDLRNVTGRELVFRSPTTDGRPMAGYGGLFWRGPASFVGGRIAAAGAGGPEMMGRRSPWLAYTGRDERGELATIAFIDYPDNPRFPTQWFVRQEPYACASAAFMFDEPLSLPPAGRLVLRYRVLFADGELTGEEIDGLAEQFWREE
ncbi:hypothetical protein Tter_1928 [Thermobaculum terrenum ATCC BAA-798]|uniref:Uncharacterized protein n=1 Tax=Thermobaculum terrenum (strain ATCC BAA-798 / CCMEE 7001 / YNP1) TaxID=525904 RepID=D1CGG3_THET1|nr:PmoA family protein [Thermobaculum terrenum]ACZ42834.1 hypothetical protein Tter_1928 [Thermobaculum terrenum ATCC BAA-798]